jgi:hypothetical protein
MLGVYNQSPVYGMEKNGNKIQNSQDSKDLKKIKEPDQKKIHKVEGGNQNELEWGKEQTPSK